LRPTTPAKPPPAPTAFLSSALTVETVPMLRTGLICASLVLFSAGALAQNTAIIKERKDHFKAMADAVKPTGAMMKGEADFDLAAVKNAIKVIQEKAPLLSPLFPDDSKEGEKTRALPAIWENKADFEERFKKLADAAKAAETSITDEDSFQNVWGDVVGNCGGCHKKYRQPDK
jgi:cytochrome c556